MTSTGSSLDLTPHAARAAPDVQVPFTTRLAGLPWWALAIALGGVVLIYNFATNAVYGEVLSNIVTGVKLTILVSVSAYAVAIVLGLTTSLGQLSKNIIARNAALLYVQVVRGIPILVQIFTVAFVVVPLAIQAVNALGQTLTGVGLLPADNFLSNLNIRNVDFVARGIIALALSYGAFSSEIFRAGIQSIERGQIDAALAVGLSKFQAFRLVIFPQAVRRVLPPLGNDFIAMLKESSLVSVLGVDEITLLGRKHASASFRFAETYNTLAFLYLSMTLLLSLGVSIMEKRLKTTE